MKAGKFIFILLLMATESSGQLRAQDKQSVSSRREWPTSGKQLKLTNTN